MTELYTHKACIKQKRNLIGGKVGATTFAHKRDFCQHSHCCHCTSPKTNSFWKLHWNKIDALPDRFHSRDMRFRHFGLFWLVFLSVGTLYWCASDFFNPLPALISEVLKNVSVCIQRPLVPLPWLWPWPETLTIFDKFIRYALWVLVSYENKKQIKKWNEIEFTAKYRLENYSHHSICYRLIFVLLLYQLLKLSENCIFSHSSVRYNTLHVTWVISGWHRFE